MKIVEKFVKKFTHNEKSIEFMYVKLDDGKWYRAIKTIFGHYILKEI